MPWKISKRNNKYCVIKTTDNTVEKCHPTRDKAKKHMAALYASEKDNQLITSTMLTTSFKENGREDGGIYFYKEDGETWRWIGIVSNNRLDRHEEIITSKGHRFFVESIENGTYAKMMDIPMPELWVWHVPVPIGTSEVVDYDERGFLIAAGKQLEGEFYTKIFEGLAAIADTLGMSHSFPTILTKLDPDNLNHIVEYMSREFTALPLVKAANWLTGSMSIAYKELIKMLQIPDHKREWFVNSFGEDAVAEFDRRLEELGKAADAVGLPKKEFDMPEDKEKETVETAVDQPVATEVEPEVIEEEVVEEIAEEVVSEEDAPEEEEEIVEEPATETGMTIQQLALPREALDEIVAGVKEPFDLMLKELQSATARIAALEKEVVSLKEEETEREEHVVSNTPIASLAGTIAKSIVGSAEAQVDYNKEREMYSGPSETQDKETDRVTGISYVDDAINRQRSGRRVVPGSVLNGQQ